MKALVDPSPRAARVMLLLTAALWSSSGLFVKMSVWQAPALLGGRSVVAFVLMWLYVRHPKFTFSKWQLLGAVSNMLTQLLFLTATKLTTATNAIFLQYTAPIYVALLAWWWLGEKPRRADWVTMLVIFGGLGLFFGDQLSPGGMLGNLMAIASGVTMASATVALRTQTGPEAGATILLGYVLSALVGLPFLFQETIWTLTTVGIVLYLGVFQIGLASILYVTAVRHVPAMETILLLTLEPVLNPIWVFLVLGEAPGPLALVGSAIVLVAVGVRAARQK